MPIYHSVTELIGRTPLLELCNYERNHDLKAVLLAKLECMNPAGSAKDRVAANMIARAEESGQLAGILERAGEFYEGEEEGALEQLLALLEPAMILLMGLIVGTVVLSVLIPLYSLYSQML